MLFTGIYVYLCNVCVYFYVDVCLYVYVLAYVCVCMHVYGERYVW